MQGIFYLQSSYSMLKNTIPLEILITESKTAGYDFVALSDDNLHGLVRFFNLCKIHQVKPIIGQKFHVTHDMDQTSFLVYVSNEKGYASLLKLSLMQTEKALDINDLIAHQNGLIIVSIGTDDAISKYALLNQSDIIEKLLMFYKMSFDTFYCGICLDSFDLEMRVAPIVFKISMQHQIHCLPIHQTSYLNKEDKQTYLALLKIHDESATLDETSDFRLLNTHEIKAMFIEYPQVFKHMKELLNSINFEFSPPVFDMPIFKNRQKASSKEYLRSLSEVGLKKRLKQQSIKNISPYIQRLNYELTVISNMGFEDYFLIVYDFVKYAKTHNILVGPGRGSAAGSLVSYVLGITDIDPILYDLLFERFLNPERITMPDIDLDFPDDQRDEVISYVLNTYGKNHTISIVTFGTFALRSSIRDIAKILKIETHRVNGIIESVLNDQVDPTDFETVRLLNAAKQIEGLPRHKGTHAAGIILSKQNLLKHIPLQQLSQSMYQSQLEASDLESLGLLKIDFLGIRNLAVIRDAILEIKKVHPNFELKHIALDDAKTYELLSEAKTNGIFQLESAGMRNVLRKLNPKTFEDIIALLALFRPGPMQHIDLYIKRKEGEPYTDLHPMLTPILSKTYGIIIYQEQIMQIAQECAGYTLAQADLLRRGISKKDREILENEQEKFVINAQLKGLSKDQALEIYKLIVKFADYGFNRSHSVAYSLIAYQMAYIKAHHFLVFMTVLLNSVIGNEKLIQHFISEIRTSGFEVYKPDIHVSDQVFKIYRKGIICPLVMIKSITKQTVDAIVDERNQKYFDTFITFKSRLRTILNNRQLEMLISSGALDGFDLNHQTMFFHKNMDDAGYEHYIKDFKLKTYDEYDFSELMQLEKEALGFNLSYHPMVLFQTQIKDQKLKSLSDLSDTKKMISVIAFISQIKEIKTKKNDKMAFLTLDDGNQMCEVTVFPEVYKKMQKIVVNQVKIFMIKPNIYQGKTTYALQDFKDIT